MDNEEKLAAIRMATKELMDEVKTMKRMFTYVANSLAPEEALLKSIQRYKEKRQVFNNLVNQGIMIGIGRFEMRLFALTGDLKKDGGQKNLSKPPEQPPQ